MWSDAVDLRDFYESRTGQVARHMIRHALRNLWPDVHGQRLLGLGYAAPYLRQFSEEAERVFAFMPAGQGVVHWPTNAPGLTALVDERELPLPDFSVDRVILVHAMESAESLPEMLTEIWRVLMGDGRLILVVPNRRGIWARSDRTPFGFGRPFSPAQITRLPSSASVSQISITSGSKNWISSMAMTVVSSANLFKMSAPIVTGSASKSRPLWEVTFCNWYRLSISGLKTCTCWRAITARRKRRINSSV
ncbi:MAG: class I SAM-dependent methyltransferase, partial [Rhodovibrionaceae bacterium]|nr:class I SAM-dependent methyltransferase [Rhodovibrionaceae bacterium]